MANPDNPRADDHNDVRTAQAGHEEEHAERRMVSHERLENISRLALMGEMASGLAHEINQPLAAIATFAQAGERLLAMPEPRVERAQQILQEIAQQALRAGDIIRRMRSLVRRHDEQRERVSCRQLLDEFMIMADPMARAARVALSTRPEADALFIDVDASLVHTVLMILYQNALDAARDQADAKVVIEVLQVAHGVEFAIVDSGSGISEAVALHLFQPFFSTKTKGTGLGLSACQKLLEHYGSRVQFANQPRGCRFWFVLPQVSA